MNKIEEKAKSIPVYWNGHCSALEWPMNSCPFLWMFCQPFSEIYILPTPCHKRVDFLSLLHDLTQILIAPLNPILTFYGPILVKKC